MMDVMFRVPSDENIVSCTITKESVEGTAPVLTNIGMLEEKSKSA